MVHQRASLARRPHLVESSAFTSRGTDIVVQQHSVVPALEQVPRPLASVLVHPRHSLEPVPRPRGLRLHMHLPHSPYPGSPRPVPGPSSSHSRTSCLLQHLCKNRMRRYLQILWMSLHLQEDLLVWHLHHQRGKARRLRLTSESMCTQQVCSGSGRIHLGLLPSHRATSWMASVLRDSRRVVWTFRSVHCRRLQVHGQSLRLLKLARLM